MLATKVNYTRSQIQTKANKEASLESLSRQRLIHITTREHCAGAVARVCVCGGGFSFQSVQNTHRGRRKGELCGVCIAPASVTLWFSWQGRGPEAMAAPAAPSPGCKGQGESYGARRGSLDRDPPKHKAFIKYASWVTRWAVSTLVKLAITVLSAKNRSNPSTFKGNWASASSRERLKNGSDGSPSLHCEQRITRPVFISVLEGEPLTGLSQGSGSSRML